MSCFVSVAAFGQGATSPAPQTSVPRREFKSRTIIISDANASDIHELRVAAGAATTLVLPQAISGNGGAILAAPPHVVPAPLPLQENKVLVLSPQRDLAPGETFPLTLTFLDGTVQSFRLVTVPAEVDVQIEIKLVLQARATPSSAAALTDKLMALQARLDECQSTADTAGVSRVASLILSQDFDKPQAFTVERRLNARHLDKQSRLLVETRAVYRLFGQSYVVLTVENRDPDKVWQMERAEIGVSGGGASTEAQVVTFNSEIPELPPGEVTKVVIAFTTPTQTTGQRFTLRLLERAGSRHVALNNVEL
ncbi:DUF2381 family protein [Pyxidicoccus sp. MSG2]|uniref:DUF2381 family protein n=1 Tax=Pyxidicoccus sp. MSG2 TaxID=2996790 RepID=UPI0022714EBB|nr:DUF2381 family protein [Pyxidicoccus sp. MSG2]MCY1023948.1 DUF2381 family protein [Pyxidicoccus sp. MSG2]